jgi:hypothetical protein
MLSSSCECMLSSSCDSEVEFDMHALLTRLACHVTAHLWKTFERNSHTGLGRPVYELTHACLPNPAWPFLANFVSHIGDQCRYGEQKIAQFRLLNEGTCIREYSKFRLLSNRHWNDLKEMYSIGLNFEYSRMKLHSLSSGCEIAQFFVRYMAWWVYNLQNTTNMRDAWRTCCEFDWRSIMLPCWVLQKSSACYHHVDVFLCNNSCRDGLRPTNSSFFQFGFSIRKCVLS